MIQARDGEREISIDAVQAAEYEFPYHYIPNGSGYLKFCKYWNYSPSYIAAVNLVKSWLIRFTKCDVGDSHRHVDYGCGDGGFLYAINSDSKFTKFEFEGVDVDERAIKWARNFAVNTPNVRFFCGSIEDLTSNHFDSGTLIEVFEHIPPSECESFVAAIAKSLKAGAPLYVTVPSTEIPVGYKHYRHFSFETIKSSFSKYFDIEECFGFEKAGVSDKFLKWLMMGKRHYVEVSFISTFIVKKFERKHPVLNGCARIALILRRKSI